jgi:DNA repair protein RAD16
MARFMRGAQICSGLATLDDGQDDSAKLDWVMDKLTGDLSDEKVVVFVYFTPNLKALSERLTRERIGHVAIWGGEPSAAVRAERLRRFQSDPACKVLIGTTSIEQSLNLQVARHMILVDTILNPARMEQLAGRVRRVGSAYETVYIHHLMLTGTQETRYPGLLEREQALIDFTWQEDSELFPSLTARQLAELVAA